MNPVFIFPPTNVAKIYIIKNMKLKKGGVDNILAIMLKQWTRYIAKSKEYMFNLSIEEPFWPDASESAEINPVFETVYKNYSINYRLFSLISNRANKFQINYT